MTRRFRRAFALTAVLTLLLVAAPPALAHGGCSFRGPPPPSHRMEGSIVDVEGAPIPSATIHSIHASPPWSCAAGDPDGTFRIPLESGPRRLVLSAAGHQPHLTPWLRVDKDGTGTLDAVTLRPGKSIRGRVIAASAFPHSAVRVRLLPEIDPVPEEWAEIDARVRRGGERLDDDGCFQFDGLAEGSYRVLVDVCAERRAVQAFQVVAGTGDLAIVLPHDLTPQEVTVDLDVRAPDGSRVEEFAYAFLDRGKYDAQWRSAGTDDPLQIRVGLPPFRVHVRPQPTTLAPATIEDFVPTESPYLVQLRAWDAGDTAKAAEAAARKQRTEGHETLMGSVTRPDGTPVIGARVTATRVWREGDPEHGREPTVVRSRTGWEGRFKLEGLPPGTYHLAAETAGLSSQPYLFQADAGEDEVVIVAHERPLD